MKLNYLLQGKLFVTVTFVLMLLSISQLVQAQETWQVGSAINESDDFMDLDNNDTYVGGPLRVGMIYRTSDDKVWSGLRQWDPGAGDNNTTSYGGMILDANTSYDIWLKSRYVGVGISTPSDKLHVYNGNIRISDPNSTTRLNFYSGTSSRFTIGQHTNGEVFLWNESNDFMQFGTNGTERMRLSSTGKLRIGSGNATEYFEVHPNTDVAGIVGRAKIGYLNASLGDYAGFAHYDHTGLTEYALLQDASGGTKLNAASGEEIDFRISNDTKMRLASTGYFGIGTTTPQTMLDVNGTIVAGGNANTIYNSATYGTSLDGGEGIIMPGSTSQYNISVQDGNGRIQHKWNATTGSTEKYLVAGEDASFIDWTGNVDGGDWIEFKFADGSTKSAGDAIAWTTHFAISDVGNIGLGISNAQFKLHVGGTFKADGAATFANTASFAGDANFEQQVYIGSGTHTEFDSHVMDEYELIVEGDIVAQRIVAAPNNEWPDYVFEETYDLKPLAEVENYIKEEGHLPNMPSAKEITEEGVDVVEVERVLLEKVEELTLYVIELEKKMAELEASQNQSQRSKKKKNRRK